MENSFGERIRELREEQGLLMRELSAKMNIDVSLLSKIENNNRTAKKDLIVKLSEIFKVNYEELLIIWFSDKVANELNGAKNVGEILKIAEQKIKNG